MDQVSLQSHVIIDTWQVRCTYLFESHVPKMFTGEYWKWVAWVSHDKIQRVKIPTPLLFKAGEPSVQGEHDTARPRWPHSRLAEPSLFKEKSLNRYHWTLPCCGSHSVSASVGYETACGCIWNSVYFSIHMLLGNSKSLSIHHSSSITTRTSPRIPVECTCTCTL